MVMFCCPVFLNSACALEVGTQITPKELWDYYKDLSIYAQPSYVLASVGVGGLVKAELFTWAEFAESHRTVG